MLKALFRVLEKLFILPFWPPVAKNYPSIRKHKKKLISGTWKIISFAIFWPPKAEIDLMALNIKNTFYLFVFNEVG